MRHFGPLEVVVRPKVAQKILSKSVFGYTALRSHNISSATLWATPLALLMRQFGPLKVVVRPNVAQNNLSKSVFGYTAPGVRADLRNSSSHWGPGQCCHI